MTPSSRRRGAAAALTIAIAIATSLTACGTAIGKIGAPAPDPTVIRLGAADVNDPQLLSFVSMVDARSHGGLHVQLDRKSYYSETPGAELKLAGALRSGKVDLGYLPSRDWERVGAPGFAALQSPGLLTTTMQAIRLAHDPIATDLLAGLRTDGVIGLGLVPEEAQRLITTAPVLTTGDLVGQPIRINDSAQTAAMIRALGGTAVQGLNTAQAKDALLRSALSGVVTGPTSASHYNENVPAPYLTSFGLFPKFEVLAANGSFWKGLSPQDQRVVQSAATAAVRGADTAVPAHEAERLRLLCEDGAVIVRPQHDSLSAIFGAADRARPADATDTALIARIAAAVGASQPESDASPVPTRCAVATTAAAAARMHRAAAGRSVGNPSRNPPDLVGTYRIDVTKQDLDRGGMVGPDWSAAITYIWKLAPDGTMYETQTPDYPDQGPVHGTWRVHGNEITFLYGGPGSAGDDFDETVRWSYFKGVLSVKAVDVQDMGSQVIYSVPWRKIG